MQRTADAALKARAVGEDAGAVDGLGLQRGLHLALVVFQLVPLEPRLEFPVSLLLLSRGFARRVELPLFGAELLDHTVEVGAVVVVRKKSTVDAAGHARVGSDVDAVAGLRTEAAAVGGHQPGQVDLDDVLGVGRVDEFQPFAGVIAGQFDAAAHRKVSWGAVWIAGRDGVGGIWLAISHAIHRRPDRLKT